jgi:Arc/MetJ-type ribon-helix-helix transcriptional regulator
MQIILSTIHENHKTLSVSLPPNQLKEMKRTAKKENRTMSELIRELYRRYTSDEARREFGRALKDLRGEAAKTPAGKLTMRQIDAEITASRRARKRQPAR